jgi:cardiolipin synthase
MAPTISIPNIITLVRILLTPLLVILVQKGLFGYALLVFTLAGISDGLDGLLARWCNQRTELGAYLDPIADKLLLISAFVSLAVAGIEPDWLAVIAISRDVVILVGISVLTITGIGFRIQPSWLSKCTTFAQISTVFAVLLELRHGLPKAVLTPLFWATAILTILSGLHYIYKGMAILQAGTDRKDPSTR